MRRRKIEKHPIGTRVVFFKKLEEGWPWEVTIGRAYTIVGHDYEGDEYFLDDKGEENGAACTRCNPPGHPRTLYVVSE